MLVSDKDELYVYKRNDGRWEARYIKGYTQDGKVIRSAVYAKTRYAVIKKRQKLLEKSKEELAELKKETTQLNLLILGAGSHGQNIKEIAEKLRIFRKISFLDDKYTGDDKEIIGTCRQAEDFRNEYICAFVAIGDNKIRKKWTKFLRERGFIIPSIIAPSATISPKAVIGDGVAILPQSTVNESVIGDCVILASNSLVDNGANVGSFARIDSGAIVLKNKKVPETKWVKSGEIFGSSKKINLKDIE